MEIGDQVAFLDEKGGGKVIAVQAEQQTVDVEIEDGFTLRLPMNKCVVMQQQGDDPYTVKRRHENGSVVSEAARKAESQRQKEQVAKAKAAKQKEIEEKRMQENLAALVGKYTKK